MLHIKYALAELLQKTANGETIDENTAMLLVLTFPKDSHQKFLHELLADRNGKIVSFNETLTALRGCNTAIYILSSGAAAKTALFYLLKYAYALSYIIRASLLTC